MASPTDYADARGFEPSTSSCTMYALAPAPERAGGRA